MSKNDITVLGLLAECPMHGYQIHQQIKIREMEYWAKIRLPSIYSTLTRLEQQGLITSGKEKVGNTPERTVYSLTSFGREKLSELVQYFLRTEEHPEWLFGLGIAFICGAACEKVLAALQIRKKGLEKRLEHLQEELVTLKEKIPFNWYILIESGYKHHHLELDLLNQLIDTVQKAERWAPEWRCEECAENLAIDAKMAEASAD
jgi:DNA-binding PadR family transcriptional regulator